MDEMIQSTITTTTITTTAITVMDLESQTQFVISKLHTKT
jgi:hypothetical protein